MRKNSVLDRVYLKNPCSTDWNQMQGDNHVRFCSECDKQVYSLSSMTTIQVEKLLNETGGDICANFCRDIKGRIITADTVNRAYSPMPRLPRFASTTIAALLGIGMSADAQVISNLNTPVSVCSAPLFQQAVEKASPQDGKSTLIGTVFDTARAVIAGAYVTIIKESTNQEQRIVASEEGQYRFEKLEPGKYTLKIESPGFVSFKKSGIELRANEQLRIDITLQVGTTGGLAILPDSDRSRPILRILSSPIRAIKRVLETKS